VTGVFDATLQNINAEWETWNGKQRSDACYALIGDHFDNAWFIPAIATTGSCFTDKQGNLNCDWGFGTNAKRGTGSCAGTVAYNGRCVQARDLHYKMLGTLVKLCNSVNPVAFNPITLQGIVLGWKGTGGLTGNAELAYLAGASAFAEEGYTGFQSKAKVDVPLRLKDKDNVVSGGLLPWNWYPNHRINVQPR